ncbi:MULTISPECIES: hypothetical protein [Yersinia]|uniref:Restriction alleviation protein, Lar family n=1 Tax=Yersinia pekkanenii TaxID=1288385 RepID=A0A0T9PIZ0_9GAMM|nr:MULTISPECIES: hypothetical protein [Yersinia]CNH67712.1 restriction alleviation protein%2C Lar family [Yersinia pekkanenii]CRY69695.1 restriction alleviation protein%2C Lar family [Yersinia pekkanenii]
MENQLLPCPLCGNDEIELNPVIHEGEPMFIVRCDCCGVHLPPDTRSRNVMVWNQRAPRPVDASVPYEVREHPVMGRFQIIKPGETK